MKVHMVTEKFETDNLVCQFDILYVSDDMDKAKRFFEKTKEEDRTGFLKSNGIYAEYDGFVESKYENGYVSYQIISREVE